MDGPSPQDRQPDPAAPREGDPAAPAHVFEEFAAKYEKAYRTLWVIAASIASPSEAADIVQQASLQAVARQDQFRPGSDFTAWIAQFVRYTALNHRRAQRRGPAPLTDPAEVPEPHRPESPDTLRLTENAELPDDQQVFDDELVHALHTLSATARTCLLLRTVQGMTYDEIATTLAIPKGTAMSHVHRSRHVLREILQNRAAAGDRSKRNAEATNSQDQHT